jgi:hypothetical protein
MNEETKTSSLPIGELGNVPIPKEELKTPAMHDASHARDVKCVPIAHELVKLLANMEKMPVGSHVDQKQIIKDGTYLQVIKDLFSLMIEKDVRIDEIQYIFSLVREALDVVYSAIDETCNQQMNRVTELMYGLELNKSGDVTLNHLNEVIKHKGEIEKVWKPILLDTKVEMNDN